MKALLRGAGLAKLRSADVELEPGRYVVLASEPEPLAELVALTSGQEACRHGSLVLDGAAPASSPETRRRIAALFETEALLPESSVRAALAGALEARGDSASGADRILTAAGLTGLAELSLAALGQRETRSVALALALAHERADLLTLHEPLATTLPKSFVLEALDRHTARGAIVLCTTTSTADAMLLGGSWLSVELGRLRVTPGPAPRLGAGPWQQVLVEASDAQSLGLLLQASALQLATELGAEPQLLRVTGPALDVTVRELITLARQHGIEIRRVSALAPPVESLLAARAGFARGAYEAARLAALGPTASQAPPAGYGGYT